MDYIRKCTFDLLAYYYANTDLEDEFENLVSILNRPENIQILINLSKDEILEKILFDIDHLVESKLIYSEEDKSDTIFEGLITEELATNFLYRLVRLS